VEALLRRDVDPPSQEVGQFLSHIDRAQGANLPSPIKVHEQVDIAPGGRTVAGDRSKDPEIAGSVPTGDLCDPNSMRTEYILDTEPASTPRHSNLGFVPMDGLTSGAPTNDDLRGRP
jgi:hypothetical protein